MRVFQKIDLDSWKRKEYFEHYFYSVPCTYNMTVNLDITKINASDFKLYPTMLYFITDAVNLYEEFRTAVDDRGDIGIYKSMHPSYTVFHKDSNLFSNIWTEFDKDYNNFCKNYNNDKMIYGKIERMEAKLNAPENTFSISMLPWVSFSGFNLNLQKGYDYLLPIFTMGKFFEDGGRTLLPLSVQVHHAVCDGFHIARFFEKLQESINRLEI